MNTPNEATGAASIGSVPPRLALMILSVSFLTAFAAVGLAPVLPQIEAHFIAEPHAAFLTKALLTIIGLSGVIGSPLTGWLMEKVGTRRLLIGGILLFLIAGTGGMLIQSLPMLVVSRFVTGLAASLGTTTAIAIVVTRFTPAQRNRWLGFVIAMGTLWASAAMALAGLIGHDFGWRAVFLLHLFAVPILLLALVLPRIDPVRAPLSAAEASEKTGVAGFAPIALLGLVVGLAASATSLYGPFRLRSTAFGDPAWIGSILLLSSVTVGVVALAYGIVRRFLSLHGCFVLGFVLTAAGMLLFAMSDVLGLIVAAMLIGGTGAGLLTPSLYAQAAAKYGEAGRARAVGYAKAGFLMGPIVGQVLIATVSIGSASGPLFALSAAYALASVLAAFAMFNARPGPAATA